MLKQAGNRVLMRKEYGVFHHEVCKVVFFLVFGASLLQVAEPEILNYLTKKEKLKILRAISDK